MRANELHEAVGRVADVLEQAGIRAAVDRFRAAHGDELTVAAARLGHAGALISERFQRFDAAEQRVVKSLHLDSLASTGYWQQLIESASKPGQGRAEIVRLAARLMFAAQNLPGLTALMADIAPDDRLPDLASGESRLQVSLVDAGERASSPDRIARAIDGIDMLYSACASIARRPAMDLRLDAIDGTLTRDLHFTGGRDAVAAVVAVMTSIPEALRRFDQHDDLDLDALVASLPVFSDLETLGSMGSFSARDLSNISETMRQGALLVLESGIVLLPGTAPDAKAADTRAARSGRPAAAVTSSPEHAGQAADRHYEAYLRERETMRTDAGGAVEEDLDDEASETNGLSSVELAKVRLGTTVGQDRARRIEVDNLLSELKSQRGHH